jgi:hypothetical protein
MTESSGRPTGRRFDLLYRGRGDPRQESATARKRIGHFVQRECYRWDSWIAQTMGLELGTEPMSQATAGGAYYWWEEFFSNLNPDSFLNAVWAVVVGLDVAAKKKPAETSTIWRLRKEFVEFARRVFSEENLAFEIDDHGGVHPLVDGAFNNEMAEVLQHLDAPAYANAKQHFETALKHFDAKPQDTRGAVKSAFETVEEVFQLIVGDRFTRGSIENKLTPLVVATYPDDDPETWRRVVRSWAEWADGLHIYRHAQGTAVPPLPSPSLCVYALSTAAAMTRTLIEVHRQGNQ